MLVLHTLRTPNVNSSEAAAGFRAPLYLFFEYTAFNTLDADLGSP
jgi:hypothetical protein